MSDQVNMYELLPLEQQFTIYELIALEEQGMILTEEEKNRIDDFYNLQKVGY